MINEMLSRVIYRKVLDIDPLQEESELGIFGANYKLAMLITIFIQVFRLAAEPFFFNQSKNENARLIYARVMKFFVITCCFMFLFVSLFLEFWVKLIASRYPAYAEGIKIVPILAMGNVFLGIYYNLSVWYKLTNRNLTGAYLTIAGALITIVLNMILIPAFHYTGAAWSTLLCYGFMMVASYIQGQKHYPIPYKKKKLLAYLAVCTIFYLLHSMITHLIPATGSLHNVIYYGLSLCCCLLFILLVITAEKKELEKIGFFRKVLYR
jgi:O-antigen/teichoic acid export membrane protein